MSIEFTYIVMDELREVWLELTHIALERWGSVLDWAKRKFQPVAMYLEIEGDTRWAILELGREGAAT